MFLVDLLKNPFDYDVESPRKSPRKRTITIYVNLHSDELTLPEPLVMDSTMANHQELVDAHRIGICQLYTKTSTTHYRQQLAEMKEVYKEPTVNEANYSFFQKFSTPAARYDHAEHSPAVLRAHKVTAERFRETVGKDYHHRAMYDDFYSYRRIYEHNKEWEIPTRIDDSWYTMGIYILGFHYTPLNKILLIQESLRYKGELPDQADTPMPADLPYATAPDPHFLDDYAELQKENLMNVDVSQRLAFMLGSKVPLGENPIDVFGVTRYRSVTLSSILKYFKAVGFDNVNVIDFGCRSVRYIDYNDDADIALRTPLLRERSDREKERGEIEGLRTKRATKRLPKRKKRATAKYKLPKK